VFGDVMVSVGLDGPLAVAGYPITWETALVPHGALPVMASETVYTVNADLDCAVAPTADVGADVLPDGGA
jgi:hypothetical protein